MNARERKEYVADGLDAERRLQFLAADRAASEWERRNPWTLDDYIAFLEALQDMFGPLPYSDKPWVGSDFRL